MILEVYDALKAAGAPEDKAQAAATVLANMGGFAAKADFEALSTKVGDGFARIDTELAAVKTDISTLKTDVSTLKIDVSTLKADVSTLKADVSILKTDVVILKTEVSLLKWLISGVGFGVLLLVLKSFWPFH